MSWLFSQALAEEYSEGTSLAGEPSAQLNVTPTQHKFWRNDKTMDASGLSRFGLTLRLLTATRGEELLMSYLAAFPVRTSAVQVQKKDWPENEVDSGWKWPESFAKYDLATSTWRTRQSCFIEGSAVFLETWPAWGSMRNGESSEVLSVERPKAGRASGLLPT